MESSVAEKPTVRRNLVGQAGNLERAEVMRDVIGPYLAGLLRPIYTAEITEAEAQKLQQWPVEDFHALEVFPDSAHVIVADRLKEAELYDDDSPGLSELAELDAARSDLFYNHGRPKLIINEAVKSGIVVPLTIASHIYRIENKLFHAFLNSADPFDPSEFAAVMERENFDSILLRLTKGPNGFLESRATDFELRKNMFFGFHEDDRNRLSVRDAYRVVDGQVTDLSDKYHLAAERKRSELFSRARVYDGPHGANSSSGCPVRHSFEDDADQKQEPLVLTAKDFLVAALRASFVA